MPLDGDPVRAAGLRPAAFFVLETLKFIPGVNVWEQPGIQLLQVVGIYPLIKEHTPLS